MQKLCGEYQSGWMDRQRHEVMRPIYPIKDQAMVCHESAQSTSVPNITSSSST